MDRSWNSCRILQNFGNFCKFLLELWRKIKNSRSITLPKSVYTAYALIGNVFQWWIRSVQIQGWSCRFCITSEETKPLFVVIPLQQQAAIDQIDFALQPGAHVSLKVLSNLRKTRSSHAPAMNITKNTRRSVEVQEDWACVVYLDCWDCRSSFSDSSASFGTSKGSFAAFFMLFLMNTLPKPQKCFQHMIFQIFQTFFIFFQISRFSRNFRLISRISEISDFFQA